MKSLAGSAILFLVLLGWAVWQAWPAPGGNLWVLDVGQGDSLLLQTAAGNQILIDGGPDDQVLVGLGRHMPFWDRTIERVILSHNHADHLSGLIEVARRYRIEEIWLPPASHTTQEFAAWQEVLATTSARVVTVSAGHAATLDELRLEVIYPFAPADLAALPANQHDTTVVTRISGSNLSFLATGDLEAEHEAELVAAYCSPPDQVCPLLAADILKVPHHGSKTGLEPEFLHAVAPDIALISAGAKNSYGHPHPLILERLAAASIPTYRTDLQGTLAVSWAAELVVEPEKN